MRDDRRRFTVTLPSETFEAMTSVALQRGHRSIAAMVRQWIMAGGPRAITVSAQAPGATPKKAEAHSKAVSPTNRDEIPPPDTARSSGVPEPETAPTSAEMRANVVANPFEGLL